MSKRTTLHYRNWHRSLWVEMRSHERFLARMRRQWARLGDFTLSVSADPHSSLLAEIHLRVTVMRSIDQSWGFLR